MTLAMPRDEVGNLTVTVLRVHSVTRGQLRHVHPGDTTLSRLSIRKMAFEGVALLRQTALRYLVRKCRLPDRIVVRVSFRAVGASFTVSAQSPAV